MTSKSGASLSSDAETENGRTSNRALAKTSLTITERQAGKVTILDLAGEIRIGGSRIALRDAIRSLGKQGRTNALLNLAKVDKIDSCGLGELVSSFVTMSNQGGAIKLLNLSGRVLEVMTITKLLTVFDVFETEDSAIQSFGADVHGEGSQPASQNGLE